MNDQRKIRILIGVVVALVLLNGALLAWMGFGHERRGHLFRRTGRATFLADTLGFSARQREQYNQLRKSYFQESLPLARQMRAARQDFYQQIDDSLTDRQLAEKAAAVNAQVTRLDVLTLNHFRQVAAICTPEQRMKLKKILVDMPFVRRGLGRGGGPPFGRRPDFQRKDSIRR
ncbi:Spy/CpxP family protein refolding chaperone [Larkinella soli]|uniref:Spy/CpxP family protein refolding chaperone n=1 Tax=Larkinella soli TaxID=1770527 RepID=UPI000FFB87FA|nr:periplasmic heavy metal sensor [Larkinella soli]